jgi:hypothetical protein
VPALLPIFLAAEKPIHPNQKRTRPRSQFVLRCNQERSSTGSSTVYGSRVPRRQPSTSMIMKFCPNYRCVAYARVVYTQTTRCAFCRWDLKPPRMKSETFADEAAVNAVEKSAERDLPKVDSHAHPRRTLARHSA